MNRIAVRLMLGFLLVIVVVSAIFSIVGIRFIGSRVVDEAQDRVAKDLNAAREIYQSYADSVYDVIRMSADRFYLRDAILSGDIEAAADEIRETWAAEELDLLTITDADGVVLFRATNPGIVGDDRSGDPLVAAVLGRGTPVMATVVMELDTLLLECPHVAEMAWCEFVPTPGARPRTETEVTDGMLLMAAAPIPDGNGGNAGVLYGGLLLNRRYEVVDKIKDTVFKGEQYGGEDIGTATIFYDDLRIATNVMTEDGQRAVGTRVSEEVYQHVISDGNRWIGRAYVVNDWYISAYEPIYGPSGERVGMLYVGTLEQPYADANRRTSLLLLGITAAGALLAIGLAYLLSRRLITPIRTLVTASREVAAGNFDTVVEPATEGELGELAHAFNSMATALKTRDEELADFARRKIMESERLAIVGQLAADVAHELNNPLQGIVAYSHLLLERTDLDDRAEDSLNKIANQATRCTTIIRGLLDFSRPRKPQKKAVDVHTALDECLSLVEDRAIFQNIRVVRQYSQDLPSAVIDRAQMQQVFMNMIINAAEAMDGAGTLTVATSCERDCSNLEVEFRDTGHGIDEAALARIFDPFFTTKHVAHGTGLGLAISFGIVREHGGTISVESTPGEGASFYVGFPVGVPEPDEAEAGEVV
jgi:two-component system NtrC family sensor kinase